MEVTVLKSFRMEQLYVNKKSAEDFRSENVKPNNLELIEALKEEIRLGTKIKQKYIL